MDGVTKGHHWPGGLPHVGIHTDGSCLNDRSGGWAAILHCQQFELVLSGYAHQTTSNRMEMTAALEALKVLNQPCQVWLYSDSRYLVDSFRLNWLRMWVVMGWKTSAGNPVANQDLWEELLQHAALHKVTWKWVKGHSGDQYNEKCDKLAKSQSAFAQQNKGVIV